MTNQGITEVCKRHNTKVNKTGNCFYCVFEWLGKDCKNQQEQYLENYLKKYDISKYHKIKPEIIKIQDKIVFNIDAKIPEIITGSLFDF